MNDTTTKVKPALYVGTYAKYNNGSIEGKWLHLEDYGDTTAFLKACEDLHSDESDPELMFQDFEGFPREFYSESCSIVDLDHIYEWINMDADDRELIQEYCDATGESLSDVDDLDSIRDMFVTTIDYEKDYRGLGEYYADSLGILGDMPENLQYYFDYEAYGRDIAYDCSISSNGFVFTNY